MSRVDRWLARMLIAAFALFALLFSLGPIFEGPDEIEHYRYAQYLAENGSFPPPDGQPRGQFHHTPLYYLLASPVLLAIDDTDFAQIADTTNPYSGFAFPVPGNDNKTSWVPSRATTEFPYASPTSRAVHLMRLLNVLAGTLAVWVAYQCFLLVWPAKPTRVILALGVLAGWQQFAFLSGMVTNDVLVTLAATAALYLALWVQRTGQPSAWWALGFGAVLAAALLAKANGLVLGFFVVVVLAMNRPLWRYVPLVGGVVVLGGGWWYLRNLIVIGDLTGIAAMYQTWPGEQIRDGGGIAWQVGLERLPYVYASVWARFGSGALGVGAWLYRVFDVMVIASLVGLAWRAVAWEQGLNALSPYSASDDHPQADRKPVGARHASPTTTQTRLYITVLAFTLIWVPMIFYYTSTVYSGNQGRFALVAVAGWALLAGWGLSALIPRWAARPVAVGFAALTLASLFGYYFPAYRPLPSNADDPPLYVYADTAELLATEISTDGATPGDQFTVTLHWRALRPTETELLAYVHSLEGDWLRRDSYPGTGTLRSTDWQPGQTWAERYIVPVPAADRLEQQRIYRVVAGLYDPATDQPLTASAPDGDDALPVIGDVAIHAAPEPPIDALYRFGEGINAATPTLTTTAEQTEVCYTWQLSQPATADYSVFVHLVDADGEIVSQQDHQPRAGAYPFTRWAVGERVAYCVTLPAALPEDGALRTGLYDPVSGERPPLVTATDEPRPFITTR